MSELGRLFVTVGANIDEFKQKMNEASADLKKTGESLTSIGKSMSLKVTAPIVGIGTAAVATFQNLMIACPGRRPDRSCWR